MKKSTKADLVSLAHKILQLRDTADYATLATQARLLYERLTVLSYAEELEQQGRSSVSLATLEEHMTTDSTSDTLNTEEDTSETSEKSPAEILAENQARFAQARAAEDADRHRPDGTQFNESDPLHEPVIEKIKDMWPEMAPEAAEIDKVIESIIPTPAAGKNDSFEIGNEYRQMPVFEPKNTSVETSEEAPKNLNDRLKNGLKIGLNDKLAFIKHLFNGSAEDYNRVLSQLETFQTATEARQFIAQMVKPDYEDWEGKEAQEERFMTIIENRYQ